MVVAVASGGSLEVGDLDLNNLALVIQRLNGQFGFNLETGGNDRNRLQGASVEDSVSAQDVVQVRAHDFVNTEANQFIPHDMQISERLIGVITQPRPDRHVGLSVLDGFDQFMDRLGRVGVVAVDHDIEVRIDAGEHRIDDKPLALTRFEDHAGRGVFGDFGRRVGAALVDTLVGVEGYFAAKTSPY